MEKSSPSIATMLARLIAIMFFPIAVILFWAGTQVIPGRFYAVRHSDEFRGGELVVDSIYYVYGEEGAGIVGYYGLGYIKGIDHGVHHTFDFGGSVFHRSLHKMGNSIPVYYHAHLGTVYYRYPQESLIKMPVARVSQPLWHSILFFVVPLPVFLYIDVRAFLAWRRVRIKRKNAPPRERWVE